jgi:RNA polymerase sigma-70 factor, ECF subfamily
MTQGITVKGRGLPTEELSEVEDATLVARARTGDRSAFEALMARYSDRVLLMALRMLGSRADAEDVTQEVSMIAWRHLADITEPAAVRTWLFRVTHRQCLAVLKSRRNYELLDVIPDLAANYPASDPQRMAEAIAGVHALNAALAQLPSLQRRVWLLAEIHGLPYLEIARISGGTEEAVRGRLARARGRLALAMRAWR